MNVRRRSGLMKGAMRPGVKNTVTDRKDMVTQVKDIKNSVCPPKATGASKIRGAVTGPSGN